MAEVPTVDDEEGHRLIAQEILERAGHGDLLRALPRAILRGRAVDD
ncbi:MAG: hypothetical protein ACKVIN_06190 [Longimicrobiales bacterium]